MTKMFHDHPLQLSPDPEAQPAGLTNHINKQIYAIKRWWSQEFLFEGQ